MRHPVFMARTVLVKNNDVEAAVKLLNRIMSREGLIEEIRRNERYEKPWQTRNRINLDRCKTIMNEDLDRKLKFLMRKNRPNPYPGC